MHTAIRAASLSLQAHLLRSFIDDADLRPLFDAMLGGAMVVSLNTPQEMRTSGLQGVSLWLYRVERDEQRLNAPPSRPQPTQLQRAPLPLRLHYLITPMVSIDPVFPQGSPLREQELLGRVMQRLYEAPVLRGVSLLDALTGSDEQFAVRLQTLTLDELSRIWHALQQPYQLSVAYEMSVAHLQPRTEPQSVAPVDRLRTEYAVVVGTGGA